MKKFIKNIKKYFKYTIRMAKSELKSEVAGSRLNWLWWVIEPLCFMVVYTFVFTVVFTAVEEYFDAFLFIG
ncbi:MAG: polysaccharide ABC transporter, partial [Bacilli bacterium]|nr:polysaccharide ABC transporter [Bacilli bacterium]